MTNVKILEKAGVKTIYTKLGILFSLQDPNLLKNFTGSQVQKMVKEVLFHDGKQGNVILRELGLTGYWAIVKE